MDTDKVIQDLNRRFAAPLPEFYQRRIIFWYDEDKEFEDKLGEVVLENAKVIALTRKLYMNCLWKKKISHKAWQLSKNQFMLLGGCHRDSPFQIFIYSNEKTLLHICISY